LAFHPRWVEVKRKLSDSSKIVFDIKSIFGAASAYLKLADRL